MSGGVSAPLHPIHGHVLRSWSELWQRHRLPSRDDIDPVILTPDVFPHIVMLEGVSRDGRRDLRYRLIGSVMAAALGGDAAGRFLRDVIPNQVRAEQLVATCYEVIEWKRPLLSRGRFLSPRSDEAIETTRLVLPLQALPSGTPLLLVCQLCTRAGVLLTRLPPGPIRHEAVGEPIFLDLPT